VARRPDQKINVSLPPSLCEIDGSAVEWYAHEDWFNQSSLDDINRARERLVETGKPVTSGRVVTELNFGFWRYLLSRNYHQRFWEPAFRFAFPNLPHGIDRRKEVYDVVERVHLLRNRIAHHEPVFSRDHSTDQELMLKLIGWICEDTRDWVADQGHVLAVSVRRPYCATAAIRPL
jgi:hypothetical protein